MKFLRGVLYNYYSFLKKCARTKISARTDYRNWREHYSFLYFNNSFVFDRKVTVKDRKSGDESTEYFDGILICAGHHDFPNYPTNAFPGKVFCG